VAFAVAHDERLVVARGGVEAAGGVREVFPYPARQRFRLAQEARGRSRLVEIDEGVRQATRRKSIGQRFGHCISQ
jgi:hypothetical protein